MSHGVLFVCLGNICRSPLARAIFADLAGRALPRAASLDIDSCGIGHWHVGGGADERSIAVARRRGVEMNHTARQIDPARDASRFHWIIAMDRANVRALERLGLPAERVHLVRSFDPRFASRPGEAPDVPDPYEQDASAFDEVFDMLAPACAGLLEHVARGLALDRE